MANAWRRWFRALHRDVGYVAVALVLAYGLSGLAVNHIADWNPSYRFAERSFDLGALPAGTAAEQADAAALRLHLDPAQVRGHYLESATDLRIFLDQGQEARLDTTTGRGRMKTVARRAVLFEVNALHLNNLKGVWTWVADLFAVALMFLAVTGMTMMKGARGLAGRGKWFVGAGLLVPASFVVYLYW
ncbi:MAG TPA: PepSY-associated TM helix domain-containing protein [Kofleriaceae bacterium]|nr:PepSY-associated TM helix domain-containing protein [Kofleriaceae bacterium]